MNLPEDIRDVAWWRRLWRRVIARGRLEVVAPLVMDGRTLSIMGDRGGGGRTLAVRLANDAGNGSYSAAEVPPTPGGGWGAPRGWSGTAYERNAQVGLAGQVVPASLDGTGSARFGYLRSRSNYVPQYVGANVTGFCYNGIVGATVKLIRGGTFTQQSVPTNVISAGSIGGVWGDLSMAGSPPGVVVCQGTTVAGVYPVADGNARFPLPQPYPPELANQPHYIQVSAPGYPTRSAPVAVPVGGDFGINISLDDVSVYRNTMTLTLPSGRSVAMNRYDVGNPRGSAIGQNSRYFGTLTTELRAAWKHCPDPTNNCTPASVATVTMAAYYHCGVLTIYVPIAFRYQWGQIPGNDTLGYNNGSGGGGFITGGHAAESPIVNVSLNAMGEPQFVISANDPNGQPGPPPCGPGHPCADVYYQAVVGLVSVITSTYISTALPQAAAGTMGPHNYGYTDANGFPAVAGNPSLEELIGTGSWTVA